MNTVRRCLALVRSLELHMDSHAPTPDYSGSLFLRCPKSLPPAIKQAARGSMTSASAYVRGAILKQLQIDGYDPKSEET
jgi:hypothetical protein